MEINIIGDGGETGVPNRDKIIALNNSIKRYIPSLRDEDIGKFGIIAGELYYLGEDGIEKDVCLNQNLKVKAPDQTVDEFIEEVENEALENIVQNMGGDAFLQENEEGEKTLLGIQLLDKIFENSGKWKIITEVEDSNIKATYGTGWYYVEKGNIIEGIGELKSNYIINYNERKAVKFDANKHSLLAYGGDLAVKDDILFTIDPALIEDGLKGDFDWLNSVEKFGFKNNYQGTFKDAAMYLDGCQYLAVPGDIGDVGNTGLTFEFYGKMEGGDILYDVGWGNKTHSSKEEAKLYVESRSGQTGTFVDIGDGAEYVHCECPIYSGLAGLISTSKNYIRSQRIFRSYLSFNGSEEKLAGVWATYSGGGNDTVNSWSPTQQGLSNSDTWNQCVQLEKENIDIPLDKDMYLTLTFDPIEKKQKFYYNGELKSEAGLNTKGWNSMMKDAMYQGDGYFLIGLSSQGHQGWWLTAEGYIYAFHIYTRPLTAGEVSANYNASVAYHSLLKDTYKGGTSGETGGDSF